MSGIVFWDTVYNYAAIYRIDYEYKICCDLILCCRLHHTASKYVNDVSEYGVQKPDAIYIMVLWYNLIYNVSYATSGKKVVCPKSLLFTAQQLC